MLRIYRSNFPAAKIPGELSSGVVSTCIHCAKKLQLSRWDDWNGFLVICPHCKKLHGKNWNKKAILWGSFFINALSFFFTMRPLKALVLLMAMLGFAVFGNYVMDRELLPQSVEFLAVILFIFAPIMLNGILVIIHEKESIILNPLKGNESHHFFKKYFRFFPTKVLICSSPSHSLHLSRLLFRRSRRRRSRFLSF